ncbi:MAG: glycoside hydrolase family 2 TIM barrel-domain containing protein [Acidobacteriaceae bacterium]
MHDCGARTPGLSRRNFLRTCAGASLAAIPVLQSWGDRSPASSTEGGAAAGTLSLDRDWRFAGKMTPAALQAGFDDANFPSFALPHSVTPLSWQGWDPAVWEDQWVCRRTFSIPPRFRGLRIFLHFDRVMAGALPVLNGHPLPRHLGGFLHFEHEITDLISDGDNLLAVGVDGRWLNAPPSGSPRGPASIDYLLPAGISGSVSLRAVPSLFLSDVFAKPVAVLDASRRLDAMCRVNAAAHALPARISLQAELLDGDNLVARESRSVTLDHPEQEVVLSLTGLERVQLWSNRKPVLYNLAVTLLEHGHPLHRFTRRIGFRDARCEVDGFFLNGELLRIFGLNRHELYPYLGFSAPSRLLRRDAEILSRRFNCNMVRCSHYPQSEAFLDACDELGLMVWEEVPGWQYIGDASWQDLLLRDVEAMIRRDRSHPSIVIWGVRANESPNDPQLYRRTRELARSLDNSRPTSGTMTPDSKKTWQTDWHQDVFAFDDYHSAPDGSVGIDPPLPGVPYLITETVGQYSYGGKGFRNMYRRAGDPVLQQKQALYHAQAHNKAASFPRCAGAIAWCAFDYASLDNSCNAVKCPGIADVFRLPKLGAAFYLAQVDPAVRAVIEPDFYWDSTLGMPSGSATGAAIFSNCDRLEVFVGGRRHAVVHADRAGFPHLQYPPFLVDFQDHPSGMPDLRIDGYLGNIRALSRSFSADRSLDRLWLQTDDPELEPDGSDCTRLAFGAVDRLGTPRATAEGAVLLRVDGPAVIVGDNPFQLSGTGGLGAVYLRTTDGKAGTVHVSAEHAELGRASLQLQVRRSGS